MSGATTSAAPLEAASAPRTARSHNGLLLAALLAALALAAWLRLPDLATRTMHGDEAVHAAKLAEVWRGDYKYDPREYHGPTLYYFALPLVWLSGARSYAEISESTLRLSTVLFGLGLIPLLWLVRDGFERRAWVFWAALLAAASVPFVFYARYFIQETLLVFWTFFTAASAWRYQADRKTGWLIAAGIGAGMMAATKETAVIALFCGVVAAAVARWKFSPRDVGIVTGISILTAAACYGPSGLVDAVRAFGVYFARAGGGESQGALHQHPPPQYFDWLLWHARTPFRAGPHWTEAAVAVMAIVGMATVARRWKEERSPSWGKFALAYTLSMGLVYAAIPYKTPWCALGFWHGATWLGGIGAAALASGAAWRKVLFAVPILAAVAHLSLQSQATTVDPRLRMNVNNPWLYAHPTAPIARLEEQLRELAKASGQGDKMTLLVIAPDGDYWPIPFYARFLKNIGYPKSVPPGLKRARVPVVIASAPVANQVAKELEKSHEVVDYITLRRGLDAMSVFIDKKVWARANASAKK